MACSSLEGTLQHTHMCICLAREQKGPVLGIACGHQHHWCREAQPSTQVPRWVPAWGPMKCLMWGTAWRGLSQDSPLQLLPSLSMPGAGIPLKLNQLAFHTSYSCEILQEGKIAWIPTWLYPRPPSSWYQEHRVLWC